MLRSQGQQGIKECSQFITTIFAMLSLCYAARGSKELKNAYVCHAQPELTMQKLLKNEGPETDNIYWSEDYNKDCMHYIYESIVY